jgi:uncharacterized protein YcfJ
MTTLSHRFMNSVRPAISAAAVSAVLMVGTAPLAQAAVPSGLNPLVGCSAPGGKQEVGALIGAVLGAAAGSNLAKHDRGTGTAVGAVVGAGVGSVVGCKLQEQRQTREVSANEAQGFGQVYSSNGVKLAQYVEPARYERTNLQMSARTNVSIRSGPGTQYGRTGGLVSGQAFQALGRVSGSNWVLVGRNGIGIGSVHGAYVAPTGGFQRASY